MKYIILMIVGFIVTVPAFAKDHKIVLSEMYKVPAPRLISPSSENVDLTGKTFLPFEWSTEGDPVRRQYYDFRIYKGREMLSSTLIHKEKVNGYSMNVGSELFQNGEVYTWAVRQTYDSGDKSRRNFASFKIIKK